MTQCVHIFRGELQQLKNYIKESADSDDLICQLYGLWTHSSNIVVHLVASNSTEREYARSHQLNFVGYIAKKYTQQVYEIVRSELSRMRQYITVDVHETVRLDSLQAYGANRGVDVRNCEVSSGQGRALQVNILQSESPFRTELYTMYPELKKMNELKIESGNASRVEYRQSNTSASMNEEMESESQTINAANEKNRESASTNPDRNSGGSESNRETYTNGPENNIVESTSPNLAYLKHLIKWDFKVSESDIVIVNLSMSFEHNRKKWKIESKRNNNFVEVSFSDVNVTAEDPSPTVKEYSLKSSKIIVTELKKLCICETCSRDSTSNENSMK